MIQPNEQRSRASFTVVYVYTFMGAHWRNIEENPLVRYFEEDGLWSNFLSQVTKICSIWTFMFA